ncbi:MAG TPA: hypothetical protein VKQ32_06755 [Polyangia bacterium]|nr:hypothetical protein [Polyangia bacterium]
MGRNPRAVVAVAVVAAAIVAAIVVVVVNRRPPAPAVPVAPVFPKPPEAHPVIPSPEEPVARPAQAFCEARDIGLVSISLRNAHRAALAAAKHAAKTGAPASCHTTDEDRDLSDAFNNLTKRTGACVSRDSELDSQWAQLDSSVLALGRCIDCTHPQADRLTGCQHMLDLVNSAEKSMR